MRRTIQDLGDRERLAEMARLARQYRGDVDSSESIESVVRRLRIHYARESGEVFVRPGLYFSAENPGGRDCDDQAIYLSAWLLQRNLRHKFVVWGHKGLDVLEHVNVFVDRWGRWLDALPDRKFERLLKAGRIEPKMEYRVL